MCAPPAENFKPNTSSAGEDNGNLDDKRRPVDIVTHSSWEPENVVKSFQDSAILIVKRFGLHPAGCSFQSGLPTQEARKPAAPYVGKFIVGYFG
jgi:hypothetical protein